MNNDLSVLIVEDDPHVLLGCQQALTLEDIPCVGNWRNGIPWKAGSSAARQRCRTCGN